MLPLVLYGFGTRSVTLREEHKLRVFKGRVLREIFGSKRDEVTGNWRRLHDVYIHDLQSTRNAFGVNIGRREWAGHVERMVKRRDAYVVLMWKHEGKVLL
jgi:hypothetical protein